jgi:hypothetical protein
MTSLATQAGSFAAGMEYRFNFVWKGRRLVAIFRQPWTRTPMDWYRRSNDAIEGITAMPGWMKIITPTVSTGDAALFITTANDKALAFVQGGSSTGRSYSAGWATALYLSIQSRPS